MQMNIIKYLLKNRLSLLGRIRQKIKRNSKKLPKGSLVVYRRGRTLQYYVTKEGVPKRNYLKKDQRNLANPIAQREYYDRAMPLINEEEKLLQKLLRFYEKGSVTELYYKIPELKQPLIEPVIETDEVFIENWLSEEYKTNTSYPEQKAYSTENHELVRSKSEVLIANMLKRMGIPYRYECELRLKNGKSYHPDFTILDVKHRRVLYLEHLGMLEDPSYLLHNMDRIEAFAQSGILLNKNLILSIESVNHPINLEFLECQIKSYLEDDLY